MNDEVNKHEKHMNSYAEFAFLGTVNTAILLDSSYIRRGHYEKTYLEIKNLLRGLLGCKI